MLSGVYPPQNDALIYKNHEHLLSKIQFDEPFLPEWYDIVDFGSLKRYGSWTWRLSVSGYQFLFDMIYQEYIYQQYNPVERQVREINLRVLFPESQVVFYKDDKEIGWVYWRGGCNGFNQNINPKLYYDNFTKDDLAFVLKNIDIFQ